MSDYTETTGHTIQEACDAEGEGHSIYHSGHQYTFCNDTLYKVYPDASTERVMMLYMPMLTNWTIRKKVEKPKPKYQKVRVFESNGVLYCDHGSGPPLSSFINCRMNNGTLVGFMYKGSDTVVPTPVRFTSGYGTSECRHFNDLESGNTEPAKLEYVVVKEKEDA